MASTASDIVAAAVASISLETSDPVLAAIEQRNLQLFRLAFANKPFTPCTKLARYFFAAARHGAADIFEELLLAGASPTAVIGNKVTTLMVAAENGHLPIVHRLLQLGVNKDLVDKDGRSALYKAIAASKVTAAQALLQAGASFEKPADQPVDWGCLELATIKQLLPVVKQIVAAGVSRAQWMTSLIKAAAFLDGAFLKALLGAAHKPHQALENLDRDWGQDFWNEDSLQPEVPLVIAATWNRAKQVTALLDHGFDPNEADENGTTPLIAACNHPDIIQLLIQRGAKVDKRGIEGRTALFQAVEHHNLQAASHLLASGADANAADDDDMTVLMEASAAKMPGGGDDVVKLLLQNGADPNAEDGDGETTLMYAVKAGASAAVVATLVAFGADVNHQDSLGQTALHHSLDNEKEEIVTQLLNLGADVNIQDVGGRAALHAALDHAGSGLRGDIRAETIAISDETIAEIARRTADINAADNAGRTALMLAVGGGDCLWPAATVQILLSMGPNVNARDLRGESALHLVCASEGFMDESSGDEVHPPLSWSSRVAALLLGAGADANAVNNCGETPLFELFLNPKDLDQNLCGLLLIQKGAAAGHRNFEGLTCLQAALQAEHLSEKDLAAIPDEILGQLASGQSRDGSNSLHFAAANEWLWSAEAIARLGPQRQYVNAPDSRGLTPLMVAASNGSSDGGMVLSLLAHGAEANLVAKDGSTALHAAVQAGGPGRLATIEALMQAGARVDAADENGKTALMLAAECGDEDVLDLLLERGASVNLEDESGCSAFWHAAANGRNGCLELLIARGAHVNTESEDGVTPLLACIEGALDAAARHNCMQTILDSAGHAQVNSADETGLSPLLAAANLPDPDAVQMLLDAGAAVDHRDSDGRTALIAAAESDAGYVIEALLDAGADVNLNQMNPEVPASTALAAAAEEGNLDALEVLIEAGADVNACNCEGTSPLTLAARLGTEDEAEAVRALLEAGADPNDADGNGVTTLMYAARAGKLEVVEAILEHGGRADLVDDDGESALQYALHAPRSMADEDADAELDDIIQLLEEEEAGGDGGSGSSSSGESMMESDDGGGDATADEGESGSAGGGLWAESRSKPSAAPGAGSGSPDAMDWVVMEKGDEMDAQDGPEAEKAS